MGVDVMVRIFKIFKCKRIGANFKEKHDLANDVTLQF